MKNIYLLIIGLFLITLQMYGQQSHVKVSGQILTHNEETLPQAVITYLLLPDSTAMDYTVSDENGRFGIIIDRSQINNALLEVSYMGYEKKRVTASSEDMKIYLTESSHLIGEIEVRASALVTKKPGKFIYSPPVSDFVKSVDSYELLKFAPLLTVVDNGISMLGKGSVTIYINGRRPVMGQEAAIEMLRSTPAEKIRRIEVISSPNSAQKASFTGGIVNVVLKSNPDEGWTGRVSGSTNYAYEKFSPRGSLYLGYSKKKFRFSANVVASENKSHKETKTVYDYKTTGVFIDGSGREESKDFYMGAYTSFAWDINPRSTFGGSFGMSRSDSRGEDSTISTYYSGERVDSILGSHSYARTPKISPSLAGSLYYTLKTDSKDSKLDISTRYNRSYSNTGYKMDYYREASEMIYDSFIQNPVTDFDAYETKAVYSHYFNEENLLEVGAENTTTHIDNDFIRQQWVLDKYIPDANQSNRFIYDEIVNAFFINYEREWNDVFSTEMGLRGEQTVVKGNQKTQEETFRQNYFHVFPQISMNWDMAEGDHNLSVDLGSSIFRPYYNYLNPFRRWLSQNTYQAGNKDLKPEVMYDVDLTYIFRKSYIFGVSYTYDKDAFGQYTLIGEDNTTVYSMAKYGHSNAMNFFFDIRKQLLDDRWQLSCSVNGYYDSGRGNINDQKIDYDSWSGSVGFLNMLHLSKRHKTYMTLYYYYSTPSMGLTKKFTHKHLLSLSLRKQFKFGGVVEMSASNLLNYRVRNYYDSPDFFYEVNPLKNWRTFSVSYSQSFGKSRVRGAKDTTSTRIDSRISN